MENNANISKTKPSLLLKILSADKNEELYYCDSVKLYCKDGKRGNEGGSIGIKKGHIKSVISLANQKISAYLNGEMIYCSNYISGIATVNNNVIIILKN